MMKILPVVFLMLFLMAEPAMAEIKNALGMMGEGAVELPVAVVKLVGGTLQFLGEVLLLPFRAFGNGAA